MDKKKFIISTLIGFTLYKVVTYFVEEAQFKIKFKKDMEEVKNQVFNNPFYKKQREELGL